MTLTLGMEKRMKGWPGEPQMEYDVLMADGNAAANAGRQTTSHFSTKTWKFSMLYVTS